MIDRRARAVIDVAGGVLGDLDVDVVLARVLESARDLTQARYAALGVLDETGCGLGRFLTSGIDAATEQVIGALPEGRGVLGELIIDPRPLRLTDLGAHPRSYGLPPGHPPMRSFLGVPVLIRDKPFGNIYVTEHPDGDFTVEDEEALVLLAEFAGLAIDHARRFAGSENHRNALEQTVAALDASMQIGRALGAETRLESVLELVAKRGRALIGARSLLIEALEGDHLVIAVGAGEIPAGVIGQRTPVEDTVASVALRSGESQRLDEDLNRVRFEDRGLGHLGVAASFGLIVPLIYRGTSYGVMVALDSVDQRTHFTLEHQRLLESFAASAATALATSRTVSQERDRQRLAAAEEERGRWARELHDETLQGLASLRLMLGVAGRTHDPDELSSMLEESISQIDLEITTLRALITDLRPAPLDELGIEAAIASLSDRAARGGLKVDVNVDLPYGHGRHPQRHAVEMETAIYRIVQEALTNAGKHAAAKRATVDIVEDEETVRITIRDDGNGFDPTITASGYGLTGMRERASLLEGAIDITSSPGQGTTIAAALPIRHREAAALISSAVGGGTIVRFERHH